MELSELTKQQIDEALRAHREEWDKAPQCDRCAGVGMIPSPMERELPWLLRRIPGPRVTCPKCKGLKRLVGAK